MPRKTKRFKTLAEALDLPEPQESDTHKAVRELLEEVVRLSGVRSLENLPSVAAWNRKKKRIPFDHLTDIVLHLTDVFNDMPQLANFAEVSIAIKEQAEFLLEGLREGIKEREENGQ
jgi:hypothetical protein